MPAPPERPAADWIEVPCDVRGELAGLRLDAYLVKRLKGRSRSEVQKLIAAGRVTLAGRPAKASSRVAAGEKVGVLFPRREDPPARHAELPILYEDAELLAVNKPGDVLSHPTDKVKENSVVRILARQRPQERLHLVHRLDRETSGVLVLAKTPAAARALSRQFESRSVRKDYLAVVAGKVEFEKRVVDLALEREGGEIKVRQKTGSGRPAATELQRLWASEHRSLVRATPRTGRLHQIRVHLAAVGHPVLGDKLYNGSGWAYLKALRGDLSEADRAILGASRQLLHAWRLRLRLSASGMELELVAPPPPEFLT